MDGVDHGWVGKDGVIHTGSERSTERIHAHTGIVFLHMK